MIAQVQKRSLGALSRMTVVAAMHAALLFVIARGLGVMPALVLPPDITSTFIDEPRSVIEPVPVDDPVIRDNFTVDMVEPERPPIADDPEPPVMLQSKPIPPDVLPAGPGSALPVPQILAVRVDARHPLTRPPYPAELIRANKQGAVELEVYVLPSGRVGDTRILKSSGFDAFDRAAMQEARRNWRLMPATRDGVPFAKWYALRVVFNLEDLR